jgi:polysaccharide biosynthesis transport protein
MSVVSQSGRHAGGSSLVDSQFDFPALGAALWRSKWKILGPTLIVALATLAIVQFITPKYLSESRVLIEEQGNIYLRPDADRDVINGNTVDDETVTSQVQLVLSRDLARAVIAKLQLNKRPEFDPALNGISPIKAVLGRLGLVRDPLQMTPEERVLQAYYDRLTVYAVDKSRVIVIDFLSQDPKLAAAVTNTIADEYLMRQREAKQDQARIAAQWLSGEIGSMQKQVADAEAKVAAFRANSNLLEGPNNTTLSAQQLGDFNAQLAAARAQEADAEAKAKIIRQMLNSGQPIESSDILNSELIRRLSEQQVTLRAELAEQSISLGDKHPRIRELKAQIADLDQQIRAEAESIARSFESDARIANARVASLMASFDQVKNQAATADERGVELAVLERDAKSKRDLLESYLAKYSEATTRDTLDSSPADARVISRGTPSNVPAYPKKLPSVLIATVATMMLCCGFVLTKELLSIPGGVASPSLVPDVTSPSPASVPVAVAASSIEPQPFGMRNGAAIADVAQSLHRTGAGRIAVLGAIPGMKTGETAIKLARALAKEARVILVGIESKNSAIEAISSDPSGKGMAELASGAASFGDSIAKDRLSPVHVISAGHSPIERIALLSSPRIAPSFEALARSYDYVVVDAGAAEGVDLEAIGDVAPQAVLLADKQMNAVTDAARERLAAADFESVTVLASGRADLGAEAVAA